MRAGPGGVHLGDGVRGPHDKTKAQGQLIGDPIGVSPTSPRRFAPGHSVTARYEGCARNGRLQSCGPALNEVARP